MAKAKKEVKTEKNIKSFEFFVTAEEFAKACDEAYKKNADPHICAAVRHCCDHTDRTYETAGTHSGAGRDIFKTEDTCCNRACYHRCKDRRNPDLRISYDVCHL